jgi:hypothetical protein
MTEPVRDEGSRRLCTKSHSFIGFLGIKIGLSGLEKAFKMRLKRSYSPMGQRADRTFGAKPGRDREGL